MYMRYQPSGVQVDCILLISRTGGKERKRKRVEEIKKRRVKEKVKSEKANRWIVEKRWKRKRKKGNRLKSREEGVDTTLVKDESSIRGRRSLDQLLGPPTFVYNRMHNKERYEGKKEETRKKETRKDEMR